MDISSDGGAIRLTIREQGRCPMSGYPETYDKVVMLSIGEAERILYGLPGAIKAAKEFTETARKRKIEQLESELRALKGIK